MTRDWDLSDADTSPVGNFGEFGFRLAGFPVLVRSSFFFTALILGLVGSPTLERIVAWVMVVFVSVLWHELGHATVARAFGFRPSIELGAMGGLTRFGDGDEPAWWRSLAISLAGPAAGLVLGTVVWALSTAYPPTTLAADDVVRSALWVNVGWSFVNLLPLLPFDGGLAMQAILRRASPRNGEFASNVVSVVIGGGACLFALSQRMFWAAYLAGTSLIASGRTLSQLRVGRRLASGWAALLSHQQVEEAAGAAVASASSSSPAVRASAAELLAWTSLHRGDLAGAREAFSRFPDSLRPSTLLSATLLALEGHEGGAEWGSIDAPTLQASWLSMLKSWKTRGVTLPVQRLANATRAPGLPQPLLLAMSTALFFGTAFEESAAVSVRSFEQYRQPDDAYNAACSFARLGRSDEAMHWLERAVDAGYRDAAHVNSDADLASIRQRPEFVELNRRMTHSESVAPRT